MLKINWRFLTLWVAHRLGNSLNLLSMIYRFDSFTIDDVVFELSRSDRRISIEPQVLDLLLHLVRNRERMVSKDELFDVVWRGRIVSDAALSSRIKAARKALGDDGVAQRFIRTVHGRGYRFVYPVDCVEAETGSGNSARTDPSDRPKPPTTRYARSGNVHIAYQVYGSGSIPLVLTPGFVSHIENYWGEPALNRWLTGLGRIATVAMFDKRGTGMSDPVPNLPGLDERMDDVRAVMDTAGMRKAVIMGVSEGGPLACTFAATHPQRCLGLVLYGSFARFTHWFATPEALDKFLDYIGRDWGSGKSLPWFAPSAIGNVALQDWWGKFERLGATPGNAIALMRMNSMIDVSEILPTIRVPTLVLHRQQDVWVDVEGSRQLAKMIPGAKLVELPGKDHLLPAVDGGEGILEEVAGFVRSLPEDHVVDRSLCNLLVLQFAEASRHGDRNDFLSVAIRQAGGRLVSLEPTRCVATFDGPARALRAGLKVIDDMEQRGWPAKAGVHCGEVELSEPICGLAVDIAISAAGAARPGSLVATRTVKDLVAGSSLSFDDLGEHVLKGLSEPWRMYEVAA